MVFIVNNNIMKTISRFNESLRDMPLEGMQLND